MERPTSRRRFLGCCGTGLALGFAGCLDGEEDPDRSPGSERTDDTTSTTDTGDDQGPVQWTESLGSPTSRPAPGLGAVYVGTESGGVYALAGDDGDQHWSVDVGDPVVGRPVVGEDAIYVVCGETALSSSHRVVALDQNAGRERWTFEPEEWWLELFGLAGGLLYVGTQDDALAGEGETLYALDAASGEVQWSGAVGDGDGLVTDDAVYVRSPGRLDAFDPVDGTRRWSTAVSGYTSGTLVATPETVCHVAEPEGSRGVLVGRDANTGDRRWVLDDWMTTSVTLHDGTLYVGGERLAAVDPVTGDRPWEVEQARFVPDAPVQDGVLYAGGAELGAYDVADGSRQWSWSPDPAVEGVVPNAVSDGSILVDTFREADPRNRYKFAVSRESGDRRWVFDGESELTDLALGESGVLVGGEAGDVVSLARR